MPELPEVETVVRTLKTLVINKTIQSVEVKWNPMILNPAVNDFETRLKNQTIHEIGRRGKYILFELDDYILISHLRMEGKYYIKSNEEPIEKHTHVIFNFTDQSQMRYHDVRKFGKFALYLKDEEYTMLKRVGYEPWDLKCTPQYCMDWCKGKKIGIKQVLLDQNCMAGIGNIYADEICFDCELAPTYPVNKLKTKEWKRIIESSCAILNAAIMDGGTTIRSYTSSLGVTGLFQLHLQVHGRKGEVCGRCGSIIEKKFVAGRGTSYCPSCQREK